MPPWCNLDFQVIPAYTFRRITEKIYLLQALLGNDYSRCPIPLTIGELEFEAIRAQLLEEPKTLQLLAQRYLKDENAIPPMYVLQQTSQANPDGVEEDLLLILRRAACQAEKHGLISREQLQNYHKSGMLPRKEVSTIACLAGTLRYHLNKIDGSPHKSRLWAIWSLVRSAVVVGFGPFSGGDERGGGRGQAYPIFILIAPAAAMGILAAAMFRPFSGGGRVCENGTHPTSVLPHCLPHSHCCHRMAPNGTNTTTAEWPMTVARICENGACPVFITSLPLPAPPTSATEQAKHHCHCRTT